jgi:hypothetical protein
MQHDIYSLGVCLLEVGLWETFVLYEGTGTAARSRPSEVLGDAVHGAPMEHQDCFEEHLIGLARSVLPQRMGTHYAEIVETCLKCMQPDNEAFGNPKLQGGDGTVIGARFIDKVREATIQDTAGLLQANMPQGSPAFD